MAEATTSVRGDLTPQNYQSQSSLFGNIPGEIRNEIFALALVQYEDEEAAYPKDSYQYMLVIVQWRYRLVCDRTFGQQVMSPLS